MFFSGWTVEISGLPLEFFGNNRIIVFRKIFQRFLSYVVLDRCKKFSALTCWHSTERIRKNELVFCYQQYRAFSHDVTAVILVFQNNETAAMLVYQTSPVGVELFSYANAFSFSNKFA